jgi:hypothetical protein
MAPTAKSDRICECRDGYERSGAACRPVSPVVTSVRALDADGQYTIDLSAPFITNARSVRVSGSGSPGATVTLRRAASMLPAGTLAIMAAATGPAPSDTLGQTVSGPDGWSFDLSDEFDLDFVLASEAEGVTASESAPTKLVIDRTPPADVSGTVKFTASTDGVSVEWSPPPSKEGVVSFEVEVTPTAPATSEPPTKATCAASPCRVDGLSPGVPMTARIRTKDAAGNVSQGRLEGFSTTRCTSAATCGCRSGYGYDASGDGTRAACLKCALFGLWGRCFGPMVGASSGSGSGTGTGGNADAGSGSSGAGSDTPTGDDSRAVTDTTTFTGTTDTQDDSTAATETTLPQATGTTLSTDATTLAPGVDTTSGDTGGGASDGSSGNVDGDGPSWLDRVSDFIETVFGRLGWSWFEGYLGTLSSDETTVADATTVWDWWNHHETTTLAGSTTQAADTTSLDGPVGVDTTTLSPGTTAKLSADITSLNVTAGEGRTIRRSFTVRVPAGTPFDSKDVSFAGDGVVGNKLVVTTKVDDSFVMRDGNCDVYQVGVEVRAAIGEVASRGTETDGVTCKAVTGRLQVRAGGDSLNVPVTITPAETQTIVIYAAAENNLDFAIRNALAAFRLTREKLDPERLKVIVVGDFAGGVSSEMKGDGLVYADLLEGEKLGFARESPGFGVKPYRVDKDEVSSTDPVVFAQAVERVLAENPSTHASVVVIDHGSPTEVGDEKSYGVSGSLHTLTQGILASRLLDIVWKQRNGRRFDVVSFHACLANSPAKAGRFENVASQVAGYADVTYTSANWLTSFVEAMAKTNGALRNQGPSTEQAGTCGDPTAHAAAVRTAMETFAAGETKRDPSPARAMVALDPAKVSRLQKTISNLCAAVRASPDMDAIDKAFLLLFRTAGKSGLDLPAYGLVKRGFFSFGNGPAEERERFIDDHGYLLDLGMLLSAAESKSSDPSIAQACREVRAAAEAATTAKNLGTARVGQLGLQMRFPTSVLDPSAPLPSDDYFMTHSGLLTLVREMELRARQSLPFTPATTVTAPAKATTPKTAGTAETRRISVNASAGGQAFASLSLVDSTGADRGDVASFAFTDGLDVAFDLPLVIPSLTDDSGTRTDVAVFGLGSQPTPGVYGRVWGTVTLPGLASGSAAALTVDPSTGAVVGAELIDDGLMASVVLDDLVGGSFSAEVENLLDGTSSLGASVALSSTSRVTYSPAPPGPYGLVLTTTDWAGSTTWATTDVVVQ